MSYKITIKYTGNKKYFILFDGAVSAHVKATYPAETFLDTRITRVTSTGSNAGTEVDMIFTSENAYTTIMNDPVVATRKKLFDQYNAANNIKVVITGVTI